MSRRIKQKSHIVRLFLSIKTFYVRKNTELLDKVRIKTIIYIYPVGVSRGKAYYNCMKI